MICCLPILEIRIDREGYIYIYIYTVGTPYNTNVGVQKIPDRAIWKPMVAMTYTPNFSDTWLRPVPHVKTAYIPRLAWANCSPRAFITDCLTTLWSLPIYRNTHSPPAEPRRAASYKMYFTHLTLFLRVVNNKSVTERSHHACALITSNLA